jgi:NADH dehydrogenase FAD-containing subunit
MDIKNSPQKYAYTCGLPESYDLAKIEESINFLMEGNVDFEFRTTVAKPFHTEDDFYKIGEWIKGSEKYFACDTVLFSVGLIPENELTKGAGIETSAKTNGAIVDQNRQTSIEGVFACGNVLHVHDLVDYVSQEANIAGKAAAGYILGGAKKGCYVDCFAGKGISYVLPQKIDKNFDGEIILYFRSNNEYKDAFVTVNLGDKEIVRVKKRIVTPGEMQTVKVKSTAFTGEDDKITVGIEV